MTGMFLFTSHREHSEVVGWIETINKGGNETNDIVDHETLIGHKWHDVM